MSSFRSGEPEAPTITADSILAWGTADLVKYLKQNPGADGGFELRNVDGWDKLSDIRRAELAKKLSAAAAEVNGPEATQGDPVDVGQLEALLNRLRDDGVAWSPRVASLPESFGDRSPTPPPQVHRDFMNLEIAAYHELVKDGGRPLFSLDLLDQVFENPGKHRDMLGPWVIDLDTENEEDWRVFSRQLSMWRDMRKWQLDNRDMWDGDDEYSKYYEATKKRMEVTGAVKLTTRPDFEETLERMWDSAKHGRLWQRENVKEDHGDRGFAGYVEAATRRLARHRFRQSFQFEEDPKQQDAWTTWVEYIEFVCWWLDKYTRSAERLQPRHDKAWKTLVDSGVLRTSDTPESLPTVKAGDERWSEEEQAEKTVQAAQEAVASASEATDASRGREMSTRTSAKSDLCKAEESLLAIKNRNYLIGEFVKSTEKYWNAKKNVRRHDVLVQSLVALSYQIKAEEKQRKTAELEKQHKMAGDRPDATRSRKRMRHPTDQEMPAERGPRKRTKRGDGDIIQGDAAPGDEAQGSQRRGRTRGSHFDDSAGMGVKADQISIGVAIQEMPVQKPTTRVANKESQRKSQQPRGIPPVAGTASSGSAGTLVVNTRDEWLKRLRKRPQKETTNQPKAQGHGSRKLPVATEPIAATKVIKRKSGGRAGPELKGGATGGIRRRRQRRSAR